MTICYKAVRLNGRDFRTDTIQWAPESGKAQEGHVARHPTFTYVSASTIPTECAGMRWPFRLLQVETTHDSEPAAHIPRIPWERLATQWRVVAELDPSIALGPQGPRVLELVARAGRLTTLELNAMTIAGYVTQRIQGVTVRYAAWDAAVSARMSAAITASFSAAEYAAWHASTVSNDARHLDWHDAWTAAGDAALALVVRGLIPAEQYDTLTGPWRSVIGPIHPDDPPPRSH